MHEAKQLGIVDSFGREGTHAPVSTIFEQGEGKLLADWLETLPDAILISTGRYQILVYRPKSNVLSVEEDEADAGSHGNVVRMDDEVAGAEELEEVEDGTIVAFTEEELAA
jgi:hypothetical protein